MLSMTIAIQPAVGDSVTGKGTHFDTFAFLNVFPNPAGVGQSVTLGIFLSTVFPVNVVAQNFTVDITNPSGTTTTIGPYTSDLTCGTVAYFTPDTVGNYTIVFKYGGQMMPNSTNWNEVWANPSESLPTTLVVQQEAVVDRSLPLLRFQLNGGKFQYLLKTRKTGTHLQELGLDTVQTALLQLDHTTSLATITRGPNRYCLGTSFGRSLGSRAV